MIFNSYTAGIPPGLAPSLIAQVKSYISTTDIALLSQALSILALLLELTPRTTFPEVEMHLLPTIYEISHSSLLTVNALDSLLSFYAALVKADDQISTHVVPNLVISVEKAKAEASPVNVSKCIAQVVKSQPNVAAGTIAEYYKHIKVRMNYTNRSLMKRTLFLSLVKKPSKASLVVLSLLIVGELGRFMSVSFLSTSAEKNLLTFL